MDVCHGVEVQDPYRWLEDGEADEVRQWSEAQGRHTRAALDAIPFTAAIRERLRVLFSIGLVSAPVVRGDRYFHQRRTGDQEQPVLYLRQGRDGADRVLLDPAALAEDRTSALDWYHPSDAYYTDPNHDPTVDNDGVYDQSGNRHGSHSNNSRICILNSSRSCHNWRD